MPDTTLLFDLEGSKGNYQVKLSVNGQPLAQEEFEYEDPSRLSMVVKRLEKNDIKYDDLKDIGSELWQRLIAGASDDFTKRYGQLEQEEGTCHLRLRIKAR